LAAVRRAVDGRREAGMDDAVVVNGFSKDRGIIWSIRHL
jgi:hypothetical protein